MRKDRRRARLAQGRRRRERRPAARRRRLRQNMRRWRLHFGRRRRGCRILSGSRGKPAMAKYFIRTLLICMLLWRDVDLVNEKSTNLRCC